MKHLVIVGDGMADVPLASLNNKTPLEVAKKRTIDYLAKNGKTGLLETLTPGLPVGSEIANLSILGYDPEKYYPGGRGPLEAPALGIALSENDVAIRINFITVASGIMKNYSAGNISTKESGALVSLLNEELGTDEIFFHPEPGYKALLVIRGGKLGKKKRYSEEVTTFAPHAFANKQIDKFLPTGTSPLGEKTAELLIKLTFRSKEILEGSSINKDRIKKNLLPANMIWFWSAGKYRDIRPKFEEKFKLRGAVISAISLIRGIGISLGMKIIDVPGATGQLDTNYRGKVDSAVTALNTGAFDFVYLHIQAPDDLSHSTDTKNKILAIEHIDQKVVRRALKTLKGDFTISVLPDHITSSLTGKHVTAPVPFLIYSSDEKSDFIDPVTKYDEKSARRGGYKTLKGYNFINELLKIQQK